MLRLEMEAHLVMDLLINAWTLVAALEARGLISAFVGDLKVKGVELIDFFQQKSTQ